MPQSGTRPGLLEADPSFRALIENTSDIITILEADGTIRYESPSIERSLGYKSSELIGSDPFVLVHPEDAPRLKGEFSKLLLDPGVAHACDFRFQHKDGSWRVFEGIGRNLLHDPVIRGIIINSRDITEREQTDAILRQSEELFRSLSASSPLGVFLIDYDGRFTYVNARCREICGFSLMECQDNRWLEFIHPEDRVPFTKRWHDFTTGCARDFHDEFRVKHRNGFMRWAQIRAAPMLSDEGARGGFAGTIEDITERKRAEGAHLRLAEIVESSNDAIVSTNLEGTVTSWNAAAERLYGYSAEEIIGQSIARITPEERRQEKLAVLRRVSNGEHVSRFESSCVAKGGHRIPVSLTVSPVKDALGNIIGTSAIILDITERKRVEEQLHLQSAALEAAANGITITDSQGKILWVNRAFTTLTGYKAEEVIGKNPRVLQSGQHDKAFYQKLWQTILSG